MQIGVLAIQGDFDKHLQILQKLKVEAFPVKTALQLSNCTGLILPGGESTTFVNLLHKHDLWEEIKSFAQNKSIFGTCAGLIVLANKVTKNHVETMGVIDIEVDRNAYGRQVDSFIDDIQLDFDTGKFDFEGVFIRAPKIRHIGQDVKPLGWHGQDVVLAEQGNILVATFHPELTDDTKVHEYFVKKCRMWRHNI